MALWEVNHPRITAHSFETVQPVEVLVDFDGPLTFTFRDQHGLLLANLCAVGVDASRYLVCKTNELTISDLKNGLISLRSALIRSPLWLIDVRPDGQVSSIWNTSVEDLPEEVIPKPAALLTDELEAEQLADDKLARFARSASDGQIAFDGTPVENHEIDAGFFGTFLQLSSNLLTEICALIDAPNPVMRAGMAFPSSYAVDLKVSRRSVDSEVYGMFASQADSIPKEDSGELRRAFEMLMSLVVDSTPNEEALTLIKRQYPLRQQYGKVLELISTTGATTVAVRTRGNPHQRLLSTMQAGERLRVVRDLGYPYAFLEVRGMLIGGQTHKSKGREPFFTIRVNAGRKPQDYAGSLQDAAVEQMKIPLDTEVWARLQIREEGKEQGYELVEIRIAEDNSVHYVK